MAIWKCSNCGYEKEGRCKPKKCPNCGGGDFTKAEEEQKSKEQQKNK